MESSIEVNNMVVGMTPDQPIPTFTPKQVNFGDVKHNQTLTCNFSYSGIFNIVGIGVSCGCTAVSSKEDVMQNRSLLVQWNIGDYSNLETPQAIFRHITVTYDNGLSDTLTMFAQIIKD